MVLVDTTPFSHSPRHTSWNFWLPARSTGGKVNSGTFSGLLWVTPFLPAPFRRKLILFISSQKLSRACRMRMAAVCMETWAEAKLLPSSARPLTMIPEIPPAERISAFTSRYLSSSNISLVSGWITAALHR